MSQTRTLSIAAKQRLGAVVLVTLIASIALIWGVWSDAGSSEDNDSGPGTYDIAGPHPGDISPSQHFADNARHYGLNADLPYAFRSNSLGFRGPEPMSDGRPVIVILGDSFAFGMGVDDGETFPDHLRAALQQKGHESVVVHNSALPGYTVADQVEQWREKLSALRPDVVLLCHTASDLKEMARPTSFRRLMRWDDEDPALSDSEIESLVEQAGGRSELIRAQYTFTQQDLITRLGAKAPTVLATLQRQYAQQLVELRNEVERSGARFGLILWVRSYGMAGLTTSTLKDVAQRANVLYFDGDQAMQTQGEVPVSSLFLPDKHFSAQGNQVAAQQAAQWLIEQGVL